MTALSLFRSEERFSRNAETDLVCRLLLEKKNNAPHLVAPPLALHPRRAHLDPANTLSAPLPRAGCRTTFVPRLSYCVSRPPASPSAPPPRPPAVRPGARAAGGG